MNFYSISPDNKSVSSPITAKASPTAIRNDAEKSKGWHEDGDVQGAGY